LQFRCAFDLPRQIGRSVDQKPRLIIGADGDTGLCLRCNLAGPRRDTIGAGAIPLRQAATGRAPENSNTNRFTLVRSNRAGVASALKKDRHVFRGGFDPLFPALFHTNDQAFHIARTGGVRQSIFSQNCP